MRFLKLALAVIAAVNGIFLTSAGPAGALPLCADGFITLSPRDRTAAESQTTSVTLTGIVQNPGQEITIRAVDQNTGNYTTLDKVRASTSGLACEYLRTRKTGREYSVFYSTQGVLPKNLWAPQSIKDNMKRTVADLQSSQGHLEIEATDSAGNVLGQSTMFDPYGVGFGPEGQWAPDAGMTSPNPGSSPPHGGPAVAWSVGHYTVEDGKKIYALICSPTTGGPHPVVIYNHGGYWGIFGAVNKDGWATPPPQTYLPDGDDLGQCLDWANRGWVFAEPSYRGEGLNITSADPGSPGTAAAPICFGSNPNPLLNNPVLPEPCNSWISDGGVPPPPLCLGQVTDVMALTDLLVNHASSITVGIGPGPFHKAGSGVQLNVNRGQLFMYGYSHGGCITLRAVEQGAPVTAVSVIEPITDFNLPIHDCIAAGGTTTTCTPHAADGSFIPLDTGVMAYNWGSPHYFGMRCAATPFPTCGDLGPGVKLSTPMLILHGTDDIDPLNSPGCPSTPTHPTGDCYNPTPLEQAVEIAADMQTDGNFYVGPPVASQ